MSLITAAVCILLATHANADIILDIPDGGAAFGGPGTPITRPATTYGWSFKITSPLTVAALGIWDEKSVSLYEDHPVGLWDISGNLIVKLTVTSVNSFPVTSMSTNGRWLFTNLTPSMTIPAGTYVLGAFYAHSTDVGDKFRESLTPTTIPGVTGVDRRDATGNSSALTFPDKNVIAIPTGYFGPNISTTPVGASTRPPTVPAGSVVNAASFVKGQVVTPGSLVSIFGTDLASSMAQPDTIPLSNTLGGASVQFVNGTTTLKAPMLAAVGPGPSSQVNVQVPWNLVPSNTTQNVNVVVTVDGVASAPSQVAIGPFSPGIFTFGPDFRALALNLDGSFAQPAGSIPGVTAHPAKVGDPLTIYATGLGAVDNTPVDGGIPASGTLANTLTKPTVLVGGVSADVSFSGLSPQFVGLNQVNIVVPNVPAGDKVPLQIQMGGITSPNTVIIAVTQ